MSDDDRQRLREQIFRRLGIQVPDAAWNRLDAALAALRREAASLPAGDPIAALALAGDASGLWQSVIRHIAIGETNFVRHPAWFRQVEASALCPLIARRRAEGRLLLRVWSAGCATGEEAYTVALALHRVLHDLDDWRIEIVGTDVNLAALAAARHASYGKWSLRELDAPTRASYFTAAGGDRYRLAQPIRDMVTFRPLNLAADDWPDPSRGIAGFDLVICRNVLIYFSADGQRAVAERLGRTLGSDGWLAVSPAEAVAAWYRPLRPVSLPSAILFRHPDKAEDERRPAPAPQRAETPALPRRRPAPKPRHAEAPASVPDPWALARAHADRGELVAARRECEAALRQDNLDPDRHLLLADICEETGDFPAALQAARVATYLAPTSAAAQVRLGMAMARLNRGRQARRCMEAAITLLDRHGAPDGAADDLRGIAVAYLAAQAGRSIGSEHRRRP